VSAADDSGYFLDRTRVNSGSLPAERGAMRHTSPRAFSILTIFLLLLPGICPSVRAQGTLSDVIGFLVTNQAIPTDDLARDRAAAESARETISRALLVNLTSVPLATSSSGFLYRLNPQLGTVERATESFGAFFVERAITAGRGRASFGLSATTSRFDELDGHNLRDGTLVTVARQFRDEAAPFDTESLTLRIRSSTLVAFGSIGVTDRLEIGAAVPFVRLTLEGERVNVFRGTSILQATGTGSASGIADVAVRAKYTLITGQNSALAIAAEGRLPTGDERNLLGAGSASYRVIGIGSTEQGRIGLHGNAALVFDDVSSEVLVAGAVLVAVHPKVTLAGEVLVRRVEELHDIDLVAAPHPTILDLDILRLSAGDAATTLSRAVAGVKWNPAGTVVLGAHVTWDVAQRGLTAPFTPTVAIEYAF
jgi:hypothetical protein